MPSVCDPLIALDPFDAQPKLMKAEGLAENLLTVAGRNDCFTCAQELRTEAKSEQGIWVFLQLFQTLET